MKSPTVKTIISSIVMQLKKKDEQAKKSEFLLFV